MQPVRLDEVCKVRERSCFFFFSGFLFFCVLSHGKRLVCFSSHETFGSLGSRLRKLCRGSSDIRESCTFFASWAVERDKEQRE